MGIETTVPVMDVTTRGQIETQSTIQQLTGRRLGEFIDKRYPSVWLRPLLPLSPSNEDGEGGGNHAAKSGQGDESLSFGFVNWFRAALSPGLIPKEEAAARLPSDEAQFSRGRITQNLNVCRIEQIFGQAIENKQKVSPNRAATTTPITIPNLPLPPRVRCKPDKPVRIKFVSTPEPQIKSTSRQTQDDRSHAHVSGSQRPQFSARPFYPPHQDPEGSTVRYFQGCPPPLRSCTPIPPTPYSQTKSLPPPPPVHLAAGSDNFEPLRNIGSPFSHLFQLIRWNAYTYTRTPFVTDDLYDFGVTQQQIALQEQVSALNHPDGPSADSIPSPSLTPLSVASPSFPPLPTSSYNLWPLIPTMSGSPGLDLGVGKSQDQSTKGNRSGVQERSVDNGRPRSKLISPKVVSPDAREGLTGVDNGFIGGARARVEGNPSEWSNRESGLPRLLPHKPAPGMRRLCLDMGKSGDPTMSSRSREPVPLSLAPSLVEGPRSRLREGEIPILVNLEAEKDRLANRMLSTNFLSPNGSSTQPKDTSPEMADPRGESVSVEVRTHNVDDTEKCDSDCANGFGEAVETKDAPRNQEAHQKPRSLEISFGSGVPAWEVLVNHHLSTEERISIITVIFSNCKETEVVKGLGKDDAQSFVNVIGQTLDSLAPQLRNRCLRTVCKICGRHGLLPKSVQIPPCYDRMDFPLCSGGFADVWKGEYEGCSVAVKVLRISQKSNLDKIKRSFCKEVMAWKSLHHQNLLPLLGATMSDNQFAMTSEWMVNGNINEYVKVHRDVDRFELLKDVVQGLIYMHGEGIVHGDLKGANILINQHHRACIADFGLAAIVSDPTYSTTSTSLANAGTVRWMSPERLSPAEFGVKDSRPTKKSDCYALGMVILEVLTGKVPFPQESRYMVSHKVLIGERPERPQGTWFTDDLWGTLEVCWSPQQNDRPTAGAVLECLMRISSSWVPPSMDDGSQMASSDESTSTPSYSSSSIADRTGI